jgi:hypothetical protein
MSDPVSAVFSLLDKGVEKITDRAFDSAVAEQRDEATPEQPTSQEELLQELDSTGQADADAPEVQEAIESGLVEKDAAGQPKLTPLGQYLAPEPDEVDETQEDTAESAEAQAQVAAS